MPSRRETELVKPSGPAMKATLDAMELMELLVFRSGWRGGPTDLEGD
jgi:hypothetical protein